MLKNKKALYILLPVNLLIWSYLGWTIFDLSAAQEKTANSENSFARDSSLTPPRKYYLIGNYRDPFLKTHSHPTGTATKTHNPPEKQAKPQLPKPDLRFLGIVKNHTTGSSSALISLNGQSHIVKANELLNGLLIKTFNRDSLTAKWQKELIIAKKI